MSNFDVHEECPHCDATPPARQLDMHVARTHADLPPCTARVEPELGGLYTCGFRAGHAGGEYGTWHASKRSSDMGRYIWNDSATRAVPHRPAEPSDSLDKFKAMGVISHTVVAAGEDGDREAPESQDEDGRPEPPTEADLNDALPVRPNPRQAAYDAVYDYIRRLGPYLPQDTVHRNAVIWRAVKAALDATPVGRCVSSHCVEDDHMILSESRWESP